MTSDPTSAARRPAERPWARPLLYPTALAFAYVFTLVDGIRRETGDDAVLAPIDVAD